MDVEYRGIADFPDYRVGDDGSMWSCRTKRGTGRWRQMQEKPSRSGYCYVMLSYGPFSKKKRCRVNRLVLNAFIGLPAVGEQAAHANGNRSDNRLCNLAWKTSKENNEDKRRHGTLLFGEKVVSSKLTTSSVLEIRRRAGLGELHTSIAKDFGVSIATIGHVAKRKTWRHLGEFYRGKETVV